MTDTKTATPLRPFKVGVQYVDDEPYDETRSVTAGTVTLPQWEIPATGFLDEIYIIVEGTVTGHTSGTGGISVAFSEDGPFNAFNLTLTDTNSSEIVGPIDGFDLHLINKWGGWAFQDDPRALTSYSATTGTGTTAGSFSFLLRIPLEFVKRDALGALPNKSASTPYKVKISLNPSATLYSTAPTQLPSVRVRMVPRSYWEPRAVDGSGNPIASNPPGVNTTSYWNKTVYNVAVGSISPLLTNSTGFPVRNLIFILRDVNGSRANGETYWPDPVRIQIQSNTLVVRPRILWRDMLTQDYGYTGRGNGVNQQDNGVYVLGFNNDFGLKPGAETRRSYLPTNDGTRLQLKGTISDGSGPFTLTVLTNYIGIGAGTTLAALTS